MMFHFQHMEADCIGNACVHTGFKLKKLKKVMSTWQAMLDAGFDRVVQVTPDCMLLEEAMKSEVARHNIVKAIHEQFAL